jgi:hypothetical protein
MILRWATYISKFLVCVIDYIIRFLYLLTPLGLHILLLQLREKADVLPVITTYLNENSTWTMIYDGVAMVNTKPGLVRSRISRFVIWVKKMWILWLVLVILTILVLLALLVMHK